MKAGGVRCERWRASRVWVAVPRASIRSCDLVRLVGEAELFKVDRVR